MIKVCPNHELLSVYFDGEMPSPWKEKMEAHISGCPDCARALEVYRSISLKGAEDEAAAMNLAKERVWQKLEQQVTPPVRRFSTPAWRRSISIPLPAAAAAVVLIAFAFLFAFRMAGTPQNSGITFASETEYDIPVIPMSLSDIDDLAAFPYFSDLDSRDNGEIIILRLPESRSFVNYGEPAIYNAADYSRQVSNRQMPNRRK